MEWVSSTEKADFTARKTSTIFYFRITSGGIVVVLAVFKNNACHRLYLRHNLLAVITSVDIVYEIGLRG